MWLRKRRIVIVMAIGALIFTRRVQADIYQWEYINPGDPSQGKQQSNTLVPGGAGLNAAPHVSFQNRNLTRAFLFGADLTGADFFRADVTQAELSHANLSNAGFTGAILTGADLTGTNVRGTSFSIDFDVYVANAIPQGTGIRPVQLYSTASYQSHDLSGIRLDGNELAGVNLAGQNLTSSSFWRANLTNADLRQANLAQVFSPSINLTNANLAGANLLNTDFSDSVFTGANLTGAQVQGASFERDDTFGGSGITTAQLYSTVSYQAHQLGAIDLASNDLVGANLADQDLTASILPWANLTGSNVSRANLNSASLRYANFSGANLSHANLTYANLQSATLTAADLSGATIKGADFSRDEYVVDHPIFEGTGISPAQLYSTADYQAHDLSGIHFDLNLLAGANFENQNLTNASFESADLTEANFRGAKLTNALFYGATIKGADFSGADVQSAAFGGAGLAPWQLASTASYKQHNLSEIDISGADFSYADLSAQNLDSSQLSQCNFNNANFRGATLTKSSFDGSTLNGADLSAADARGAQSLDATGAVAVNFIQPNGHVAGLSLNAGQSMTVHNYQPLYDPQFTGPGPYPSDFAGPPPQNTGPLPIVIDQNFKMTSGCILQLRFDGVDWNSLITFQPGIPVSLGGTLDLEFTDDVNVSSQVGRKIHLFDWSSVSPAGTFTIGGPYTWDASQLYTSGDVTLMAVPEPASIVLILVGLLPVTAMRQSTRQACLRIAAR